MKKIAIITALSGNREPLTNPSVVHNNADYFAFVDRKWENATVWNQQPITHFSNDKKFAGRRNAKQYKVLPHLYVPGYEFYFWVDISHDVIADPEKICDSFMRNNDIALFRHNQRSCIYQEAGILKELQYDHLENIERQVQFYKSVEYPENNGLYELPVSVRRNTHNISLLNMKWWDNICKYSSRDQLSMPFCLWETGITPAILPGFANGFDANGNIGANSLIPQVRHHVGSGSG